MCTETQNDHKETKQSQQDEKQLKSKAKWLETEHIAPKQTQTDCGEERYEINMNIKGMKMGIVFVC